MKRRTLFARRPTVLAALSVLALAACGGGGGGGGGGGNPAPTALLWGSGKWGQAEWNATAPLQTTSAATRPTVEVVRQPSSDTSPEALHTLRIPVSDSQSK